MLDRRGLILSAAALWMGPAAAAELLELERLYGPPDMAAGPGPVFSDLARAHDGRRVRFRGFMAPPLMAESRFVVLATVPMSVCPFCDTDSEWPNDILAVFAKRVVEVVPFYEKVEADGVLRLGSHTDADTGFVSMVRLEDAVFSRA
jgi:hypothetical protein